LLTVDFPTPDGPDTTMIGAGSALIASPYSPAASRAAREGGTSVPIRRGELRNRRSVRPAAATAWATDVLELFASVEESSIEVVTYRGDRLFETDPVRVNPKPTDAAIAVYCQRHWTGLNPTCLQVVYLKPLYLEASASVPCCP
ncbi:MAG: hypothetical protein LC808_04405, partial [Actinobacteria bacterium]|nr:hypothetical protein [Actinomycetota bacterium]